MELTETIEMTFADLAATVDHTAAMAADRIPPPADALVVRVGAINAEAVRQTGRVAITAVDAARGVVTVAATGVSELAEATFGAAGQSARTLRSTTRRAGGDLEQAASTIRNRARGATSRIERNFRVVGDQAERVGSRVERKAEAAADDVVRSADAATAKTASRGARTPTGSYENWTKGQLYDRAQELDIDGRSQMSKGQLIRALRDAS